MEKLKVIELFAGIGSQTAALKRLGIQHEVVCVVEWDKYAYQSYQAIHGPTMNLGDITKVSSLPGCDLLTYSFPCQDISVAGHQKGFEKGSGTRSGLLWEVERLLLNYKERGELPTYLLLENVKNLIGKQNKPDFMAWLSALNEIGYNTYYKVLNAKNYGVPQNRERVFAVSVLKDKDKWKDTIKGFEWPEPFDNGLRLKDFLEDEVDEKYYISDDKCAKLIGKFNQTQDFSYAIDASYYKGASPSDMTKGCKSQQILELAKFNENRHSSAQNSILNIDGISPVIDTMQGGNRQPKVAIPCITPDRIEKRQNGRRFKTDGEPMFTLTGQDRHGVLVKEATKQGFAVAYEGDSINLEQPDSKTRRGRVGNQVAQTLTTSPQQAVIDSKPVRLGNVYGEQFGTGYAGNVWDKDSICPTLMTMQGGGRQPHITMDFRIRKLTPKECWRLMGFTDEDFEKAEKVCSNSQLYKQAGNSIVVDVLMQIFSEMFLEQSEELTSKNDIQGYCPLCGGEYATRCSECGYCESEVENGQIQRATR